LFADQVTINGKYAGSKRLPNTCNMSFLGRGLQGKQHANGFIMGEMHIILLN
jgi:hypothetical protein